MKEGGFVNQDKMYLINKIFNSEEIRTVWNKEEEKYYVSVVDIGELTTRELAKKHRPIGLKENRKIAKEGGQVARNTRKDIEARLGEYVVTKENALNYKYMEEKQLENN